MFRGGDPDDNRPYLLATIDKELFDVPCSYYAGDPRSSHCRTPWPGANAWFEQTGPGQWHCLGPIGLRRVLFHDDFLHVTGRTGAGAISGEIPWTVVDADDVHTASVTTAAAGIGIGVLSIVPARSNSDIGIPELPLGFHYSLIRRDIGALSITDQGITMCARVRAQANGGVGIGFISADTLVHVIAMMGFAGQPWQLVSPSDGGITALPDTALVADTWVTLDFVADGSAVHAWADGDGPYSLDVPVAYTASAFTPTLIAARAIDTATPACYFDWATVASARPIAALRSS
jgi:hypothetical protein